MNATDDLAGLKTNDQIISRAREITESLSYGRATAGAEQEVTMGRNAIALYSLALVPGCSTTSAMSTLVGAEDLGLLGARFDVEYDPVLDADRSRLLLTVAGTDDEMAILSTNPMNLLGLEADGGKS